MTHPAATKTLPKLRHHIILQIRHLPSIRHVLKQWHIRHATQDDAFGREDLAEKVAQPASDLGSSDCNG